MGIDPWENLANAIVLQAVEDYKITLKGRSNYAAAKRRDLEKFFRSGWFGVLTAIDPEDLIRRLWRMENFKEAPPEPPKPKPKKKVEITLENCFSVAQAAKKLKIPQGRIYKDIREGRLKALKANGIMQIRRADLEDYTKSGAK